MPSPGMWLQGTHSTHLLAASLAPDMWPHPHTPEVDNGAGPPSGTAGLTVDESGLVRGTALLAPCGYFFLGYLLDSGGQMPAVSVGALQPVMSPEYVELLTAYGREHAPRE